MGANGLKSRILHYLKDHGPANTFRLARGLGVDRHAVLRSLEELRKKEAIEFRAGTATFLKHVAEEKKAAPPRVKKVPPVKARKLRKRPSKKPEQVKKLQEENRLLKEKLVELENSVKNLEEKAHQPPKVIRKTIVKEVPKIVTKTIIKRIPIRPPKKPKKRRKKLRKAQKIKLPKITLPKIKMPKITLPKMKMPKIKAPGWAKKVPLRFKLLLFTKTKAKR